MSILGDLAESQRVGGDPLPPPPPHTQKKQKKMRERGGDRVGERGREGGREREDKIILYYIKIKI